jgi:hypothetical protein
MPVIRREHASIAGAVMSVQTLEVKSSFSVASVLKLVKGPLKIPVWSLVLLVIMAGVCGYVSGRKNPLHHYVPYVGYPLVMDTTTGKACYSTTPKAAEDGSAINASYPSTEGEVTAGPAIPLCGK